MSTVKRISGEYTIQSIGASDPINLISSAVNIDGNLTVTGNLTGIGAVNTVRQSSDANISSASLANVGLLTFTALANKTYKFDSLMYLVPANNTTTGFSLLFSAGSGQFVTEVQTTATSTFSTATSNTSQDVTTQAMTGTTLRAARISGTFYHTANTTVTIQAQTSAANLVLKTGSYLSYTRIS